MPFTAQDADKNSSRPLFFLFYMSGAIGKIIFVSVSLKCPLRARGAVRIARQPSKLKVMGSNPIGPAITSLFSATFFSVIEKEIIA